MSEQALSGSIMQVNHKELEVVMKRAYETRLSLFVQGGVGIGKSTCARRVAREKAKEYGLEFKETKIPNMYPDCFNFVDLRLAQKDAGEVLGLPDNYVLVELDNKVEKVPVKVFDSWLKKHKSVDYKSIIDYTTCWSSPSWFPRKGYGIIFIDEFNLAPPLVQNVMYELILDRCLGDNYLPDNWGIFGAGNRGPIDGCPVFDFAAALNSRFLWYELKVPSIEEWTEWALSNGIDFRIISFLQVKRSALYSYSQKSREKVFPNPRGWERASKLIKGIEDEREIYLYVSGAVGTFIASEFEAFLKEQRKLPPAQMYVKNPAKIAIPKEKDLLFTLCCNLADYYSTHTEERAETLRSIIIIADRFWREYEEIGSSMEYSVFLLKLVKSVNAEFFKETILNIPEFGSLAPHLGKYLLF